MTDPVVTTHEFYIPMAAPALAGASACFPYAVPMTASDAARRFPEGGKRVRVTITVEEIT